MSQHRPPAGINPAIPNVARMYDYYLGGKDNFEADREAAERVLALVPEIREGAVATRAFLRRAVRELRKLGVDQFVDIGSGLPTAGHVHEAVGDAKVVYVDNDPVVLTHSRALLRDSDRVWVQLGDLRKPEELMEQVLEVLDPGRPMAVLVVSVLHFVTDEEDPEGIMRRLRDRLPAGGYLVLSHVAPDARPSVAPDVEAVYQRASSPFIARRRPAFERFTAGLELLEPGIVNIMEWRPEEDPVHVPYRGIGDYHLCAVGRKPA
ncbi:SAM-dependent methyltransferase [Thermoactinospora rubra]|uniref:SAM-dependent methyltransferase n=1 Tax=Thermoactinospora rubra TaxID=1088767 RepID=UPI000A1008FD|nr:SAM-dependent methyltransferase [Thermoactinospora rubra]